MKISQDVDTYTDIWKNTIEKVKDGDVKEEEEEETNGKEEGRGAVRSETRNSLRAFSQHAARLK